MKNSLVVLLITFSIILFESCNNDFNINTTYEETYALNCILRNDTNIQYAVISKSVYTENGTVPGSSYIGQNVRGVDIKIFYNDSVFVMRDTTIQVNDTRVNCYYIKNLKVSPGKSVSIEASIPGGKTLKASIIAPKISYGNFADTFPQRKDNSKRYDQPNYLEIQSYNWDSYTIKAKIRNFMSLPEIKIIYGKFEDGKYQGKEILLPLARGYDEAGNIIPINQKYSYLKCCFSPLKVLDETMWQISGNDPNKKNYVISKVLFKVTCFEEGLSGYYTANNEYRDDFTLKIRPTDVTNIEGGKGVFGACYVFTRVLLINKYYIQSFGYQ